MLSPETLRQLRRIDIRAKRLVDGAFAGHYQSVFKGRGTEFAEVREYVPGDDVRTIDWNVTARLGQPVVKRQIEERELTVMLLVDVSASGNYGSSGQTKLEVATELAAVLCQSAIRNHDRVGMILFSDRIEKTITPKGGRNRTAVLLRELMTLSPAGQGTDIAGALAQLQRAIGRRTVSFLLSDLHGSGYERALRLVNKTHEVVPICLRDPREEKLPDAGLVRLRDLETGASQVIDTGSPQVRAAFEANQQAARLERKQIFASLGLDLVEVDVSRNFITPLVRFFRLREQRRRGH